MGILDANDLTLHLSDTAVPPGQIALEGLSKIAGSMQELATRLARQVVGLTGPGRTPAAAAKVVDLRLIGLSAGSTVLEVSFGEPDVLPLDVGVESEIAARFWEVMEGVESGRRPEWVAQPIADSALRFVDALTDVGGRVEIRRGDGRRASWTRADVRREPWQMPAATVGQGFVTVTGRLEKVDLHNRRFRIRDDVGNTVSLTDVVDADQVGPLVGQRAAALGVPTYDAQGRLHLLGEAVVSAAPLPDAWKPGCVVDRAAVLAAAPGPDPDGIEGLTYAEVDEFLSPLRE